MCWTVDNILNQKILMVYSRNNVECNLHKVSNVHASIGGLAMFATISHVTFEKP